MLSVLQTLKLVVCKYAIAYCFYKIMELDPFKVISAMLPAVQNSWVRAARPAISYFLRLITNGGQKSFWLLPFPSQTSKELPNLTISNKALCCCGKMDGTSSQSITGKCEN